MYIYLLKENEVSTFKQRDCHCHFPSVTCRLLPTDIFSLFLTMFFKE